MCMTTDPVVIDSVYLYAYKYIDMSIMETLSFWRSQAGHRIPELGSWTIEY